MVDGLDEEALAAAMRDAVDGTHAVAVGGVAPGLQFDLLDGLDGALFEDLDPNPRGGPVRQFGTKLEVPRAEPYGTFWDIADQIGQLATDLPPEDAAFRPSSVLAQRYGPTTIGVSPHRDSAQFRGLIVIATLEGEATFALHDERDGPPTHSFAVRAGDICVLPAVAPGRPQSTLPFHAVSGALDRQRTSLTFRQLAD